MHLYARPHLTQKIPDFTAQRPCLFIYFHKNSSLLNPIRLFSIISAGVKSIPAGETHEWAKRIGID